MMQENENAEKIPLRAYLESLHERAKTGMDEPQEQNDSEEPQKETAIPACILLAEYIRERSRMAQLACRREFVQVLSSSQEEEKEIDEEAVHKAILAMKEEESCADICVLTGKKDEYYYAYPVMVHSFAQISADILDRDIAGGIERAVRGNQLRFGMPTPMAKFTMYPYFYTKVQIQNAVRQLLRDKEDIEEYVTGNRKSYLYVKTALSAKMARALAEDCETDEWGGYRN